MNTANGWFQKSNFVVEELGDITFDQALEFLKNVDWSEYRSEFNLKLDNEKEICPPGFGLKTETGSIFHLYISDCGWNLMLGLREPGKFLGFIPKPIHQHEYKLHNLNTVPEILELFFADEKDSIFRLAQQSFEEL